MNNLGTRVTDVNQVAEQLLSSDNCSKDQIHQTRDQLNNRSELTYKALQNPLLYTEIYLYLMSTVVSNIKIKIKY